MEPNSKFHNMNKIKTDRFFNVILPAYFRESNFAQNGNEYLNFQPERYHHMDGMQSEIYTGKVCFKDNNGNIKFSTSLLIKTITEDVFNLLIDVSFSNELFVYNRILPSFAQLNANSSMKNLFPEFYHAQIIFQDGYNGIQILENLQEDGYRMAKSKVFLDFPHLLLMMKKIGEFHAYSYQAKKICPEIFYSLAENLVETSILLSFEKDTNIAIHEYYLQLLATYEKYQPKVQVIREIIKHPLEFVLKVLSTRTRIAVICHGDFTRNNVMFKFDSENNPIDAKLIDLANVRYCSPIIDVGLVLYLHSTQDLRNQYWDQLVNAYYDSLKNTFPDNNLVPSKSEILDEFNHVILEPYIIAMNLLPMMMESEENPVPDFFINYFAPEHEQYKCLNLAAPRHVVNKAMMNMVEASKKYVVLDILFDIINRGFV